MCRENTVEAFLAARRLGADGVELDVRRTGDGAVVVHHDSTVPGGEAIASLAAVELPEWVPSLEAAVEACAGMALDVELKDLPGEPGHDPSEPLAVAVARFVAGRELRSTTVVSSFSLTAIEAVRVAEPDVVTAWLTPAGLDQLAALQVAAQRGCAALHPRHEAVTRELVDAAHRLGLAVTAWTVDDPERIRWLAQTGADAVITNVPDVARQALGGKG